MITIKKTLSLPFTYPVETIAPPEQVLFFDIETTGFSGDTSTLYLIGCLYRENGAWQFIQWFADTLDAERACLVHFFEFMENFTTLVHFNGDGFDIPYLLKRARAHGLPYDFSNIRSFDIYRVIKPYKRLLGLDSIRQKAIEAFLGVRREDRFSGGELIEVYQAYLHEKDDYLERLLLLHNEDDLKGMPLVLPILCYRDFWEGDFSLESQSLSAQTDIFGNQHPELSLTFAGGCELPVPISRETPLLSMEAEGRTLSLSIPLFEGTLKYYYPNYKDYYYLPFEDKAIHKSVAEFVDKNARQKATRDTCYIKKAGLFLPQLTPLWEPCLKRDAKSRELFVPYSEELFCGEQCSCYLRQLLEHIKSCKG